MVLKTKDGAPAPFLDIYGELHGLMIWRSNGKLHKKGDIDIDSSHDECWEVEYLGKFAIFDLGVITLEYH